MSELPLAVIDQAMDTLLPNLGIVSGILAIMVVIASVLTARYLSTPISHLNTLVRRVTRNQDMVIRSDDLPCTSIREINQLSASLQYMTDMRYELNQSLSESHEQTRKGRRCP